MREEEAMGSRQRVCSRVLVLVSDFGAWKHNSVARGVREAVGAGKAKVAEQEQLGEGKRG